MIHVDDVMNLRADVDFKCGASFCYGIGTGVGYLKALQTAINRYSAIAGFTPLNVDGLIGDTTLRAARAAAVHAGAQVPATYRQMVVTAPALTVAFSKSSTSTLPPTKTTRHLWLGIAGGVLLTVTVGAVTALRRRQLDLGRHSRKSTRNRARSHPRSTSW